jgi:hypothetical protein
MKEETRETVLKMKNKRVTGFDEIPSWDVEDVFHCEGGVLNF